LILAGVYAVGGLFIAADAALNAIPIIGQGKALITRGVKVGLKRIFVRGGREVLVEGVERAGRRAAGRTAVQLGSAAEREVLQRARSLETIREKYRLLRQSGITRQRSRALMESGSVCFLAGTLVESEDGFTPIEKIVVGDHVLSRDDATGKQGFKKVTEVYRGKANRIVDLKVAIYRPALRGRTDTQWIGALWQPTIPNCGSSEEGESGQKPDQEDDGCSDSDPDYESFQTLRCTPEHPFWVEDQWIQAQQLKIGDKLLGSKGESLIIIGHEVLQEQVDRYNIEVEDWHTYFVAERELDPSVWVHNTCGFNASPTNLNLLPGNKGYRPSDFNLQTIGENVQLRKLWQQAIDEAAVSTARKGGNSFQQLARIMKAGGSAPKGLTRQAFGVVSTRFNKLADAKGLRSWVDIHHWNGSLGKLDPKAAFDWNHLVPLPTKDAHRAIHRITTGQNSGIKMYTSPVLPKNRIPIGPY
jgi:hypothetical protein